MTNYGLLGKQLSHSFSKEIHEHFTNKSYHLIELDDISSFLESRPFKGINVTIPYKKAVISYLDDISKEAKAIGVVNTIINKNNQLIGYNTDYYGIESLLKYNSITVKDKSILILGNGSTSRTIEYYCQQHDALDITIAARHPKDNQSKLSKLNKLDYDLIFNATPVGMYPNILDELPITFSDNYNIEAVIDVIYNPLSTPLLTQAKSYGIKVINGLYMLVTQAIKAIELFHGINIPIAKVNEYYHSLLKEQYNIVLIGMPMSGKSLYGDKLSKLLKKELVDIDAEIELSQSQSITDIFKYKGEPYFRNIESKTTIKYAKMHNNVISCGGGVIVNNNNIKALKSNGIILFIDTPLSMLQSFNPKKRPLLKDNKSLEILYNKRYNTYINSADIVIKKDTLDIDTILKRMVVALNEYTNLKWS